MGEVAEYLGNTPTVARGVVRRSTRGRRLRGRHDDRPDVAPARQPAAPPRGVARRDRAGGAAAAALTPTGRPPRRCDSGMIVRLHPVATSCRTRTMTTQDVVLPAPDATPVDHRRAGGPGRTFAVVAGLVTAGVALGVAELLAGLDRAWRSPVLDVGDRLIDAAPPFVKEFAIDTFGTNDKPALLIGIGVVPRPLRRRRRDRRAAPSTGARRRRHRPVRGDRRLGVVEPARRGALARRAAERARRAGRHRRARPRRPVVCIVNRSSAETAGDGGDGERPPAVPPPVRRAGRRARRRGRTRRCGRPTPRASASRRPSHAPDVRLPTPGRGASARCRRA